MGSKNYGPPGKSSKGVTAIPKSGAAVTLSLTLKLDEGKIFSQPIPEKKFSVLGDVVAVQVMKFQNITDGGLHLPDSLNQESWVTPVGRVVAVGKDVKEVKEGDVVLIGQDTPTRPVRYMGQELHLTMECNILGIVPPPGKNSEGPPAAGAAPLLVE